ncbi:MAG: Hsp70 family protein, partial [Dehalococcoidales bacterium]
VEAKNNADNMAYSAEKTLRDNKEKIEADLAVEVENKVAAVREVLKGSDVEAIKQATQELSDTLQKVGSAIYSQQQQEQQPPPPPEGGTEGGTEGDTEGGEKPPQGDEGEGTVEGEFREV